MRSIASSGAVLVSLAVLAFVGGCRSGAAGESFLSVFGLSKKPIVVAICAEPGKLNPFAAYEEMRTALANDLNRPVRLDLALPFQLGPNLGLGFYDFAVLTPAQYAAIPQQTDFPILATSIDEDGRAARSAVLLVRTDSPIESVEDLKGHRVAFGPTYASRSYFAAVALLDSKGVQKADLAVNLLPVPHRVVHVDDARSRMRGVYDGTFAAAFVDEGEYQATPRDTRRDENFGRLDFRVVARTASLPDKVVVRSKQVDDALAQQLQEWLTAAHRQHPEALAALRISQYVVPDEAVAATCRNLVAPEEATMPPDSDPIYADDAEAELN